MRTVYGFTYVMLLLALVLQLCTGCSEDKPPIKRSPLFKGLSFVGAPEPPTARDLDSVVNTASNAISLMPFAYLDSENKEISYMDGKWQWKGETIAGIEAAIGHAQQRGIACMIKPQLWIDHGTFTGYFVLQDDSSWQRIEADYTRFIMQFAQISERHHLPLFCIATELDRWAEARPDYWRKLIAEIKQVYKGKLVYACNWDGAEKIPFWQNLDYIGIDAYHPLTPIKTPTLAVLQQAWDSVNYQFEQLHAKHKLPILFTEWGYQACDFPSKEPWTEDQSLATNELAQANCFRALWEHCAQQPWFAGGFVWKWFPPDGQEPSQQYERYSPQGRLAEKTLKEIYQSIH